MKLPPFKQLRYEDFKAAGAPQWIANVFYVLNNFMNSISQGLHNNLTFRDNIDCQIFEYQFTYASGYEIDINTTINHRVDGCFAIYCFNQTDRIPAAAPTFTWSPITDGIHLEQFTGLTVGKVYTVRLMIL